MEKDILLKLKMRNRDEVIRFLKSLWNETPQACPLCGGTPTTTEAEKFSTPLVIDSEAYDSNSGKLYLSISPASWSSDIKANSTKISIRIDGVTSAEKVTCSVTAGKNADGMQEIIIDLSGQSVTTGSTISYTIPESFLVSKAGTQFNSTYSSSVSF